MVCFNSYVTWVAASWMLWFCVCVAIPDTAETKIKPLHALLRFPCYSKAVCRWRHSGGRNRGQWLSGCVWSRCLSCRQSIKCWSQQWPSFPVLWHAFPTVRGLWDSLFRLYNVWKTCRFRYSKCLRLLSKKLGGWKATWAAAVECWQGSQDPPVIFLWARWLPNIYRIQLLQGWLFWLLHQNWSDLVRLKDRDMAGILQIRRPPKGAFCQGTWWNMMISGAPKFQKDPDTQSLLPMEKNVQTVSQAVEGKWFCLPLLQIYSNPVNQHALMHHWSARYTSEITKTY